MKWVVFTILIVYFTFTSGLVFEVTQSNSIGKLDIPYSIALSAQRTGLVGIFTNNDVKCAIWLRDNSDHVSKIYADINGFVLLTGYMEPYHQLQEVFIGKGNIETDGYLFLTEWNIQNDKMVMHMGQAGMRQYTELPDVHMKTILYQSGLARIYK